MNDNRFDPNEVRSPDPFLTEMASDDNTARVLVTLYTSMRGGVVAHLPFDDQSPLGPTRTKCPQLHKGLTFQLARDARWFATACNMCWSGPRNPTGTLEWQAAARQHTEQKVNVILFRKSGRYYTEEKWRIPHGALTPAEMCDSPDFRRVDRGAVLIPSQEPWGYPHMFPSEEAD